MTVPVPVPVSEGVLGRVRMRRAGVLGPRGGGVSVSGLQRTRLLNATFAVVSELGYKRMTVRLVAGRAGVSNKTFYDLFADREDCFFAAFAEAVDSLSGVVVAAWGGEREWVERVRAGLAALLGFLDREPQLCSLVMVEALGAGRCVLERRAEVLEHARRAIDLGRTGVRAGRELPPLTAESVVGAAFGVIHTRLLQDRAGPLLGLLGPLMATIVLPYRGHAAAARELSRPIALPSSPRVSAALDAERDTLEAAAVAGRPSGLDFRLTQRTYVVLHAIGEIPGASNRQVAGLAEVIDQGQISKLLARLERHGLVLNTGGVAPGLPNAWHLTPRGEDIVSLSSIRHAQPPVPVKTTEGAPDVAYS